MKKKIFSLSFMGILFIISTSFQNFKPHSNPPATGVSNLIVPFSQTMFIFSPNGGEMVSFAGSLHLLTIFIPTDPLRVQTNVMNVTGTGLSSGLTYKVIGSDNSMVAASPSSQLKTTHIYRILPPNPIIPTDPIHMEYTIDLDSDGFVTDASVFASTIMEGLNTVAKY